MTEKPPVRGGTETYIETTPRGYVIKKVDGSSYYHLYRPNMQSIGLYPSLQEARAGAEADNTGTGPVTSMPVSDNTGTGTLPSSPPPVSSSPASGEKEYVFDFSGPIIQNDLVLSTINKLVELLGGKRAYIEGNKLVVVV
ncbi:MAG: hypothetical protein FIB08_07630 [Candidatus Methanoperedens sp.]|nr:hypothetical protein [Candidatus Methanoperedens sp.]